MDNRTSNAYSVTLHCACGATLQVSGKDVEDIIKAIDEAGWRDRPRPEMDVCPACQEEDDEAVDDWEWA